MSTYPHSLVCIVPSALRDTVLAMGQALGVDGGLTVELSASGSGPATHYGAHSWAGVEFAAVMLGSVYPDPLPEGVTEQDIDNILAAITVSVDPVVDEVTLTKRVHFDHVTQAAGLQVIQAAI